MATLYLTTVVALLVTSTVLVTGTPVYKDEANMLDKLTSLLERNQNQEQAQMAEVNQEEADNQLYKDQEDLLSQMILEMLTNKKMEIESVDQKQSSDMKETDKATQENISMQSISKKLLEINKEEQEIAEALVEKISQLQMIQTSLKSLEAKAQQGKFGK